MMERNHHTRGAVVLRRGHKGSLFGCIAIGAGLLIILSMVLPTEFWWFLFAAALIALGIWYIRC